MNRQRGRFITFEGTEGVGKSTQLRNAADTLRDAGVDALVTREPGGTAMAESIREVLLAPREETVHQTTELLLMFAARAQHLNGLILPALAEGRWVLCDRFTDATFAYQGGGRGVPEERIALLEQLVQADVRPDYTVLLDADVETGMARARKRGSLDRFEREAVAFFERVRATYHERARRYPQQYRIVDAGQPLDDVTEQISALIRGLLSE